MKTKYIQHFFILCLPSAMLWAQLGLGKIGEILDTDLTQKGLDKISKEYEKSRKDYEDKAFNYAISVADNAALFENEQKAKKYSHAIMSKLANQSSSQSSPASDAAASNNAGEIFYASHKYVWAEKQFQSALLIYENHQLTEESGYSLAMSNLALLYNTTGRFEKSMEYTQKALLLRRNKFGEKNAVYAASLNNISVLYKDMGMYSQASDSLEKAIKINSDVLGTTTLPYAIMLNNKAMLQYTLGQYQEATITLKPALEIAEKELGKNSFNLVRLKSNLALIYKEMGLYGQSEEILKKCIAIKEKKLGTGHPDYANLLTTLASLYIKMQRYGEVEDLLKKSSEIYKKELGTEHPSYASSLSHLGNFYRAQKRLSDAEMLLVQAKDIREGTLGTKHADYASSLEDLAIFYWAQNEPVKAASYFDESIQKSMDFIYEFFPALSENEKSKLWDKTRPKLLKYYAFVNQYKKQDLVNRMYNLHIATKGILLTSATKIKNSILGSGKKDLIKLYDKWLDQKEDLARYYTYSKVQLKEESVNLDSLEKETDATEKKLSQSSQLFKDDNLTQKNITYLQVAAKLKANEAAVEVVNFKKFDGYLSDTSLYCAFVLYANKAPMLMEVPKSWDLDKRMYSYYKNSINSKQADKMSYQKFWKVIDSVLTGKTFVYLSLDGVYNLININTLRTGDGKYILDKYTTKLIANTRYIAVPEPSSTKTLKDAVFFAYPEYGNKGTIVPLPGTKVEVDKANVQLKSGGFKTIIFSHTNAHESNMKAVKNPYLLHIATHGYFQPDTRVSTGGELDFGVESQRAKENPLLRSGLLLANAEAAMSRADTLEINSADNGIFTAYEAMALPLDQTEIVFLSACETGKGESKSGEGVYGLQRAIQIAGAKAVVMSLWKVSDETTQQLINIFYREWLKSGNKTLSLAKAQKELKIKYPEPLFWGGFVMLED